MTLHIYMGYEIIRLARMLVEFETPDLEDLMEI
jgi:hypothetical protein